VQVWCGRQVRRVCAENGGVAMPAHGMKRGRGGMPLAQACCGRRVRRARVRLDWAGKEGWRGGWARAGVQRGGGMCEGHERRGECVAGGVACNSAGPCLLFFLWQAPPPPPPAQPPELPVRCRVPPPRPAAASCHRRARFVETSAQTCPPSHDHLPCREARAPAPGRKRAVPEAGMRRSSSRQSRGRATGQAVWWARHGSAARVRHGVCGRLLVH